jgi:hypothetical protein
LLYDGSGCPEDNYIVDSHIKGLSRCRQKYKVGFWILTFS